MHRMLPPAWVPFLLACSPELPAGAGPAGAAPGASLGLDPPPRDGAIERVVRAAFDGGGEPVEASSCAAVMGDVGKGHLSQLASGEISAALEARLIPSLSWSDGGPSGRGVVAPLAPLEPGSEVAFACGQPALAGAFEVRVESDVPVLERRWPPAGAGGPTEGAVWCGEADLPAASVEAAFDPGGAVGVFVRGATPAGIGASCVRVVAGPPVAAGELVVPPLSIDLGDVERLLTPEPFDGTGGDGATPLSCEPGQVGFGPGCARVLDDRLIVETPETALLWGIAWAGHERVVVTEPGQPFVLRPLPPASHVSLLVETADPAGVLGSAVVDVQTRAPQAHLVLNEVLADAKGPEPEQEWIEIYNDGSVSADLGGWALVDVGGETVLPDGVIPPGGFAVLVNDGYSGDGEYDPAPAPGTIVLAVPSLGKNGLSNQGEPLKLCSPSGEVASRFPDTPKPKAGRSVARVTPAAPDGWPASFVLSSESSTPGAPNGEPGDVDQNAW